MKTGTKLKKLRKSGFLSRMQRKSGQKILNNQRRKKQNKTNVK
uniref:Ribosomal protein L34 n=1 Tax=Bostrychia tenella TaxID=324755 RepID=A0A1Z1M510_9FLOR|nr:ribosomal protein L34 [Bostrychia tenella]ARW61147.1 ribosomal protein L34 [Bostrychia tenella]